MLSITPQFTMQDIENDLIEFQEGIKQDMIQALKITLIQLVDKARMKTKSEGGFGNITWNLRGSIGGLIMADNQVVETYFPPLQKGEEGIQKGIDYATDIAHLATDGEVIMVFVAGMEYASLVEGRDDTDVISGTSKYIEEYFRAAILK